MDEKIFYQKYLTWIKKILERYIVVEDIFLDYMDNDLDKKNIELISKVYKMISSDNYSYKTEVGEYITFMIDNKSYRMGKYIKDNKEIYFICHDIEKEKVKEKVKVR